MLLSRCFFNMKAYLGTRIRIVLLIPWLFLVLAALFWVLSLQSFDLDAMKDWGLVSIFPSSIIFAYVLLLIGFSCLYYGEQTNNNNWAYILYTVLLVLMLHATPLLLFGTVRYSWAWKHVGIIDYIIRHGVVNPKIAVLDVYHDWPGFFALNALITQLSGFSSAEVFAGWGPAFFELFFAFGVLSLSRLFTTDHRLQWLTVWFFLLTNWVGQDYFSPQAMTYFMFMGFLVIVFKGFGVKKPISLSSWKPALLHAFRFFRLPDSLTNHIINLRIQGFPRDSMLVKASTFPRGLVVLLIFGAIVSSHQLTPNMGEAVILVLVLLGAIRWRMLPVWMAVLILFWLAFPARAYQSQVLGTTTESLGAVTQTVSSGLVDVTKISPGQVVVSWMGRGLTAFIILLAGLGAFQRLRKGYFDLHVILLAAAPVSVLFLNSYGGEALFRVYFFSLPYFSFLAAALILPMEVRKHSWIQPFFIGVLSFMLLIGFLFANYGKERQYSFTKAEVAASEYLYTHAVPNSLLVEGSRNYPAQFFNYDFFNYVPIDREPSPEKILNDPVGVMTVWLSDTKRYQSSYFIITRSQKVYTDEVGSIEVGSMPPGSLDRIENALIASGKFKIVFSNQDAIIFTVDNGN